MTSTAGGERQRSVVLYLGTLVLCLLMLTWTLELWSANWAIPFRLDADARFTAAMIKGLLENGWIGHNPLLGAPGQTVTYDFPWPDNLHWLALKVIGWLAGDYGRTINIFFVLTFPLTALVAVAVMRAWGASDGSALLAGLLFTFLPFHFWRGEVHLFYSAYYTVALTALLVLWVFEERVWPPAGELGRGWLRVRRLLPPLALAAVLGSTGVYNAYFTAMLLVLTALLRFRQTQRCRAVGQAAALVLVIVVVLAANLAPCLAYRRSVGPNPGAVVRQPIEGELYGLKLSQLILPVTDHRIPRLAEVKAVFNRVSLYVGAENGLSETDFATLGAVGSLGLVLLLASLVAPSNGSPQRLRLHVLAGLTLALLLICSVGGVGPTVALKLKLIRCYNRSSIYLGFFCLLAVAYALDAVARRAGRWPWFRLAVPGLLGALLAVGLLDQTTEAFVPTYEANQRQFASDEAFVQAIEAQLPPRALVFQLPYEEFPEPPTVVHLLQYEQLRPYLHSRHLHWSYGAIKGRAAAGWCRHVAGLSATAMVDALQEARFAAIVLNRTGYEDHGASLIQALEAATGQRATASADDVLVYLPLTRAPR